MTGTLSLPADVEGLYLAEAQARGLPLEEVILQALLAACLAIDSEKRPLSAEEWMRRFEEWSESATRAHLPDLPDEAMSRESIYADRGL